MTPTRSINFQFMTEDSARIFSDALVNGTASYNLVFDLWNKQTEAEAGVNISFIYRPASRVVSQQNWFDQMMI